jgi:signal transduction histidine kinase
MPHAGRATEPALGPTVTEPKPPEPAKSNDPENPYEPEPVWPKIVQTFERARPAGLLAAMRIRKKLIVLHTVFSLTLALVLVLVMRPALERIVREAELHEARLIADVAVPALSAGVAIEDIAQRLPGDVRLRVGDAATLALELGVAEPSALTSPEALNHRATFDHDGAVGAIALLNGGTRALAVEVRLEASRAEVRRLYIVLVVALLGVYGLIALSLEVFVLPRNVWRPIGAMLDADEAVRDNRGEGEIVPERVIPGDELGQIMRSRNATVRAMRDNQARLSTALSDIERIASDLQRKNHLLETAKRNLADADRLASLGMMSAGLAHEINTPLAVIKGLGEKLAASPEGRLDRPEAQLLVRVIGRLERLSESLLDFARARPPTTSPTPVAPLVDEAWALVSIDRQARGLRLASAIPPGLCVPADAGRLLQVLVNLIRNAADAMAHTDPITQGQMTVSATRVERDGACWVSIVVADQGPGLSPEIAGRLFEPFSTTKLDARGTGLGLAVSQGIISEHGGLLTARNRGDGVRGAEFEILLPTREGP